MKKTKNLLSLFALLLAACIFAGCLPVAWVSSYADSEFYKAGNFTYSADEVDSVYVHWYTGEIQFVQSDKKTLNVYESGKELVEDAKLHWYLKDGELRIEFCRADYNEPIASADKHLVVELPAGIDLVLNDAAADVTFGAHTFGEVAIYSISGKIALESLTAEKADIGTISGQLQLGDISAEKRARFITTSGPISVKSINTKELELSSVSGNVTFQSLTASQEVEIETTSGEVTVHALAVNKMDISSVSGAVKLGVNRGKKLEVETNSGAVEITLGNGSGATVGGVSAKSIVNKSYKSAGGKYVFGNGACNIEIQTVSGAVTIR